jgi:hypothetical protein
MKVLYSFNDKFRIFLLVLRMGSLIENMEMNLIHDIFVYPMTNV